MIFQEHCVLSGRDQFKIIPCNILCSLQISLKVILILGKVFSPVTVLLQLTAFYVPPSETCHYTGYRYEGGNAKEVVEMLKDLICILIASL